MLALIYPFVLPIDTNYLCLSIYAHDLREISNLQQLAPYAYARTRKHGRKRQGFRVRAYAANPAEALYTRTRVVRVVSERMEGWNERTKS